MLELIFKLKDGTTLTIPKTDNIHANDLINIILNKQKNDEAFPFTDDEKTIIIKAKEIKSIEIIFY